MRVIPSRKPPRRLRPRARLHPARVRIGRIPYLNVLPFVAGGPPDGASYVTASPRELSERLAAGAVDAAPLPVTDVWRLGRRVVPLGNLGIATEGAAESVLLFARSPVRALRGPVRCTPESSTSVRLLAVLLRERFGRPDLELERGSPAGDAFLLIGDPALAAAASPPRGYPVVHDLGEEWTRWTGLPFVFARWVARREITASARRKLTAELERRLEANLGRLAELAARARRRGQPSPAARAGLTAAAAACYLSRFHYHLGARERAGAALFRRKLLAHGLLGDCPWWRHG